MAPMFMTLWSAGCTWTIDGVAAALKERNPAVKIGLADPPGAAMHAYFTTGELRAEGSHFAQRPRPVPRVALGFLRIAAVG